MPAYGIKTKFFKSLRYRRNPMEIKARSNIPLDRKKTHSFIWKKVVFTCLTLIKKA